MTRLTAIQTYAIRNLKKSGYIDWPRPTDALVAARAFIRCSHKGAHATGRYALRTR